MSTPRTTSLTVYVRPDPQDSDKSWRGTFRDDGLFYRPNGQTPLFDPERASYATSDHVDHVVAYSVSGDDPHPIIVRGDTVSSARLANATIHSWKKWLTLDEMLKHKSLGATAPAKATIIDAYAALRQRSSEIEA